MPTIFDIDFNQQSYDLMPPDKRQPKTIGLLQALLSAVQWCRDLVLGSYKTGAIAPAYSPGTYPKYYQVLYKKAVFISLIDGNTAAPDTSSWQKIQDNFIGVDERVLFNGTKLIFEYALNKWFNTQFRQPNSLSDIYLTTNIIASPVFRVGIDELQSSNVGLYISSEYVTNDYSFSATYGLTINIPTAVYNALGVEKEAVVRNFADRYVTAGINYNINPY